MLQPRSNLEVIDDINTLISKTWRWVHHDNEELTKSPGEAVDAVWSSCGDERKEGARAAKTRVFFPKVRELLHVAGRSLLGGSSEGC